MADMDAAYRKSLEDEFVRRRKKNPRYSLRAFAAYLNVDVSYLSKLRSGKIILSVDLAAAFANRLKLLGPEKSAFILSAAEEQKCHALYLIDPSLTECDPTRSAVNQEPAPRTNSVCEKRRTKS
jgi:transcriptional regulator with XRE-family HTH domain